MGLRLLWDRHGNGVIVDEVTFKPCLMPKEAELAIKARLRAEKRAEAAAEQVKKLQAELERLRNENQRVQKQPVI